MTKRKPRSDEFVTDLGQIVRKKDHRHPEDGIWWCDTCGYYSHKDDEEAAAARAMG